MAADKYCPLIGRDNVSHLSRGPWVSLGSTSSSASSSVLPGAWWRAEAGSPGACAGLVVTNTSGKQGTLLIPPAVPSLLRNF